MFLSLFSQLLLANYAIAITQTCVFKTGVAEGYVACDPTASQGTCCDQGEACLESGLCSGSLGLVYRGACINEWSSTGCVTYCDDKSANWANLYPCTGEPGSTGSGAPAYYWCGNSTDVTCSNSSGTILDITPGVAIKLLTDSSSSTASSSATSTSTSPATTTTNAAQQTTSVGCSTDTCNKSDGKVAAVGAGLGVSLGALSLAMFALFMNERRRRKKVERATVVEKPVGVVGTVDPYSAESKPNPPYSSPQELGDGERLNELGPGY